MKEELKHTDPELFEQIRITQAITNDIEDCESIDVPMAYKRTWKMIKSNRKLALIQLVTRYAAMLAIPLLVSSLVLSYLYFNHPKEEVHFAEVITPLGSMIRYELPDKSVIWLNSGSKLRYPTKFASDKREVDLEGEAYFEVQADNKHPFYVNTPSGMSVYVYGTKFNVNAYEDENLVEAVLEKGKVNVIAPDRKTVARLEPGEKLQYDKSTHLLNKMKVDVYEKTAWREGKLIFRNTSLHEILRRLARHYNVDIEFHNNNGKEYKYRATFTNENITQILDYLSKSAALKWKVENSVQNEDGSFTRKRIIVNLD